MQPPDVPQTPAGDIQDPDWYPEAPNSPEGVLDSLVYIWEMIVYVLRMVVYLVRALVLGIGNIISKVIGFTSEIAKTLSFLPPELTTGIVLALIGLIVIKLLKRGS